MTNMDSTELTAAVPLELPPLPQASAAPTRASHGHGEAEIRVRERADTAVAYHFSISARDGRAAEPTLT
jgi:hypothetical protein